MTLPRSAAVALLAVAAAGLVAALWWFGPLGEEGGDVSVSQEGAQRAAPQTQERVVSSGELRGLGGYETRGTAVISVTEDGSHSLRLLDFETSDGPDLLVWLSTAPAESEGLAYTDGHLDLGPLQATSGDQRYDIPDGVDPTEFNSVVVWSRGLSTGFGSAPVRG